MQSRACSGFAEPQPTLAIVISITSAKLQKIPEITKLFGDFFQRKKCAKGNLFLYGREFRPLLTSPNSGEELGAGYSPPKLGGARGGLNKRNGSGFSPPLAPPDSGGESYGCTKGLLCTFICSEKEIGRDYLAVSEIVRIFAGGLQYTFAAYESIERTKRRYGIRTHRSLLRHFTAIAR